MYLHLVQMYLMTLLLQRRYRKYRPLKTWLVLSFKDQVDGNAGRLYTYAMQSFVEKNSDY